jgi:hypothetical protein
MVHGNQEIRSDVEDVLALDPRILPEQSPGGVTQGDGE